MRELLEQAASESVRQFRLKTLLIFAVIVGVLALGWVYRSNYVWIDRGYLWIIALLMVGLVANIILAGMESNPNRK